MGKFEAVRSRYQRFADKECKGYSDLYFQLAHAAADDHEIIDFIAVMPETQPNLFFGAVQFVTGPEGFPRNGGELNEVVNREAESIRRLMHERRTQTNEPGRCASILPALPEGPLAIFEVGTSGGLCLLLDDYRYDYGEVKLGKEDSPVTLRCEVSGPVPFPDRIPEIAWRGGMDLRPNDLHREEDARWLLSCVWWDHRERRRKLEAAIELARRRDFPVWPGNLVTDLPDLLRRIPDDLPLVVFHTAVLLYLSAEERNSFAGTLAEFSKRRPITWISNESRLVIPEMANMADISDKEDISPEFETFEFLLGRTRFEDGERVGDELLALAHPHGSTLRWR